MGRVGRLLVERVDDAIDGYLRPLHPLRVEVVARGPSDERPDDVAGSRLGNVDSREGLEGVGRQLWRVGDGQVVVDVEEGWRSGIRSRADVGPVGQRPADAVDVEGVDLR